jgi:hypothetical protein
MTEPISATAVFGRASSQGTLSSAAVDLPGQSTIGRVSSLLFDSLQLQAGSGEPLEGWRVEVVSIPLQKASRRRIRLTLRGALTIVRKGQARISLSCGPRRISAELIGREEHPLPGGELPSRKRPLDLNIVLPRSVRPRIGLLVLIFLEVSAESTDAQSEAVVDSLDIEAI